MAENPGENPYVREMEFVGEDGGRVHVRIESPREGLRSAAIRSAMVNHCSLYPVEQVAPANKDTPFAWLVILGVMIVTVACAAILGLVLHSGISYEEILFDPRTRSLVLLPAFFVPFAVLFFLLIEHRNRRFRRKARTLSERYAGTLDARPMPNGTM